MFWRYQSINKENLRGDIKDCKKGKTFKKCVWHKNHTNKSSLKNNSTIQNLHVIDSYGVPAAGLQVITRRSNKDIFLKKGENVEEKTDKKLLELTKDISKRLNENVFSKEGEYIINQTRVILNLPKLAMKVKSERFIKVAVTNFGEWIEALRNIPIEDMKYVPLDELKSQYKLFLSRLEDITRKYTMEELQNLDAKILIKFLWLKGKIIHRYWNDFTNYGCSMLSIAVKVFWRALFQSTKIILT